MVASLYVDLLGAYIPKLTALSGCILFGTVLRRVAARLSLKRKRSYVHILYSAPASGNPARPGRFSERPDAYVHSRVAVSAYHHSAVAALVDPYLQRHGLAVPALRAIGGGVSRVYLFIRDTSLFSFMSQYRRNGRQPLIA